MQLTSRRLGGVGSTMDVFGDCREHISFLLLIVGQLIGFCRTQDDDRQRRVFTVHLGVAGEWCRNRNVIGECFILHPHST